MWTLRHFGWADWVAVALLVLVFFLAMWGGIDYTQVNVRYGGR